MTTVMATHRRGVVQSAMLPEHYLYAVCRRLSAVQSTRSLSNRRGQAKPGDAKRRRQAVGDAPRKGEA